MRADRLVATLLFMQTRGRITAAELAAELEVSVRTARRDLEALAMAGVPVYSQAGKGGGWSLIGGARTDLTGLNADEVRTLFLLTGPSSTVSPEAKAALRKLVQALPSTLRAEAEAAAAAVVVDPATWGRWNRDQPEHLPVLQRAVIDGVQVRLGYVDREANETTRVVHPLGLVDKAGAWYLIAETERGRRTFHLARVRSVEPTGDPIVRPDDFSLADAWADVVDTVEGARAPVTAQLLVGVDSVGPLRSQFGRALRVVGDAPDGRVEVELRGWSTDMLARQLAGWGRVIEVVEPAEIVTILIGIGEELTSLALSPPER